LINLHNTRQTFDFDCGAKALQTVMAYYGVDIREDILIRELGAGKDGTRVEQMMAIAAARGFQVEARDHMSIKELKKYIDNGNPVIVLLQAWVKGVMTIKDWQQDYDDGHYAIVIGYEDNIWIFEDPSSFRRTWLREHEFLARWHDLDEDRNIKYKRFGLILSGKEPMKQIPEHMN
jgi:predicted double-glycine peptidase